VTFDVLQAMNSSPLWYADIAVYNLTDPAAQNVALTATHVTLKAGFQVGPSVSSIIWDGPVFQTLFTQENVVDQKLTLHCVAFAANKNVSFSIGEFATQQTLVARMLQLANQPPVAAAEGTQGTVAAARMSGISYPRGNTVFGSTSKFLSQIADSDFLQTWFDGRQSYISEANSDTVTPNLIYAPPLPPGTTSTTSDPAGTTTSIIGTPHQTPQGVIFTVLLDPRLKVILPPMLVQLARTQIAQTVRTPDPSGADGNLGTPLQANQMFFVAQVRHFGDTRGNDWGTEVTGWSTAYSDTQTGLFTT
jgi:hypothetical protein